ncbi:MAG TPA: two-component regulator propeller domain-containing protein [Chitinophagaceae bacterium]|nr:two-component regulator propeller domain-containing protein [Chitinophagaceae bacterium]
MRSAIVFILLVLAGACMAQRQEYRAFTTNDGLPSNYIYRAIEDDRGFLWVATDAGIARFDGSHFEVFTTKQGLPDNEVLAVAKETGGRIWVNCFKQKPAYFDALQNRFINSNEDSSLAIFNAPTALMEMFPWYPSGMAYYNENGTFIFKDKKAVLTSQKPGARLAFWEKDDGTVLRIDHVYADTTQRGRYLVLFQTRGEKKIDSFIALNIGMNFPMLRTRGGYVYNLLMDTRKCYVFSGITFNPLHCKVDSIITPEPCNIIFLTGSWLVLQAPTGRMYVYDKQTLQPLFVLSGDYEPNSLYRDNEGNLWVSTVDKGLIEYKKSKITRPEMPKGITNMAFLSIAITPRALLAGNFFGQVVEINSSGAIVHQAIKGKKLARQRKIIRSQGKIFTFSEEGISINYVRRLFNQKGFHVYAKTATVYDDSNIIVGDIGYLQQLNTITDSMTLLLKPSKRVTAITKAANGIIYFGSVDGLYKYNLYTGKFVSLAITDRLLSERITGLCITPDSLLWVATAGNGLLAVQNGRVALHLTQEEGLVNNDTRCITAGGPGQVWLGTDGGISIVGYTLQKGVKSIAIQNLTRNDGLPANIVNEMDNAGDSVYAATSDGIAIIPTDISIPKFNIPIQLTRVSINQRDTVITGSYNLGYTQKDIQIQFAGIELGGHYKNAQYTLDKNKTWISIPNNILTLQLSSGSHTLQLRAVDVNGNISNKICSVEFNIATPFWEELWFWIALIIAFQALSIYSLHQWVKKKREQKLAKQIAGIQTASLEQQAFTSLMNPHFMFNALNSIQHYVNLQDRISVNKYLSDFASLIRKNFETAQQSFISLEQEIENIRIYLRLEQMRFNERFLYEINIHSSVDADEWMIPTMMMQPFLENAVLHGVTPSPNEGRIVVDVDKNTDGLIITITDNGIGMANSQALKQGSLHNSLGMQLIKKRIAALSLFGPQALTLSISPAFENEKNPGVKIVIVIPHQLYPAWLQAQRG